MLINTSDATALPSATDLADNAVDKPLILDTAFPLPSFTFARIDKHGRRMPQVIAHRGFKGRYPENSMLAFRSAAEVGVHAIETDVHMSKDGVVVLSHDATLTRCFNVDLKITESTWDELKVHKSTRKPGESLARLEDLLQLLAQPAQSHLWLLLDIKLSNPADDIMRRMAELFQKIKPLPDRPWPGRVVLGCWAAKFIPPCSQYLPGFPVTYIGFSIPYARRFLTIPNLSFNLLLPALVFPAGRNFVTEAQAQQRPVYSWTCNDVKVMDWCIRRGFDAMVTDEPEKMLSIMSAFNPDNPSPRWPVLILFTILRIHIYAWIMAIFLRRNPLFAHDQKILAAARKS